MLSTMIYVVAMIYGTTQGHLVFIIIIIIIINLLFINYCCLYDEYE